MNTRRPGHALKLRALKARRPTRKAVQSALAAQAPPDWQPKPVEKRKPRRLEDDALPAFEDDAESL